MTGPAAGIKGFILPEVVWQQCVDRLQDELPSQQFNTWIRPLQASTDGRSLTLMAPNRFIKDFVSDKFAERIAELVRELGARAVDILQPDICGTGGFSEMRRVADMAAMAGVRLVPHVWGTGVQIAASLQFMAALPPNPPRKSPIEPIMEFDRTENPFRQAVVTHPLEHDEGWVTIPDGPGLGIEIDHAALAAYAPATA